MQHLSTDARPEVRNSGVRTLFSVVVSHGAHLSPEQWQHCWWSMLFPLLRTVHHMSTTSSREEVRNPAACETVCDAYVGRVDVS
jgi:C-terminal region of Mon2 protein